MAKTSVVLALAVVCSMMAATASLAQVHDGVNNSPAEQETADELRAQGSACTAPACHNNAEGIYPQSTTPGVGAKTPSISSGHTQN